MTERNNKQNMGLGTWIAFTLFRNLTLSKSMAQSPSWTANSPSACQEGTCSLWKLKIHYRIHKIPPLLRVLSQMTAVLALSSYFLKFRFNIILPYTSTWSSNRLLPSGFSTRICMKFSLVQCMPHDSSPHSFQNYHPSKVWRGIQIMKLLIKQSCPPSYYLSSLRSEYPPRHPALKHAQPVILLRKNKVSHPCNNGR